MRFLLLVLLVLLASIQWRIWWGDSSVAQVAAEREALETLEQQRARLEARNDRFRAEVLSLQSGHDALEEQARLNLGVIGEDETFFQIIEGVRPDHIAPPAQGYRIEPPEISPSVSRSPFASESSDDANDP